MYNTLIVDLSTLSFFFFYHGFNGVAQCNRVEVCLANIIKLNAFNSDVLKAISNTYLFILKKSSTNS